MTNYTTPTPGDPVWIYESAVGGSTRARRATVARVTKTTFTLDNDKRYLRSHLPRLVRHGSAGARNWDTGSMDRLLADGDPLVAKALRQGANRRAAKHVETALEPFTERAVRTGREIVTPEEIDTMIDALRLYQSRARDDSHAGPAPVIIDTPATPKEN